MVLLTQGNLMKIFSENWDHIRHMERYRMLSLNIYVVILGGVLYILSTGRVELLFSYVAGFLAFFTFINLLIAVKIEAVTSKFVKANYKIVDELNMEDYAPIRTRHWIWKVIRFQWIFPGFYAVCLIGIIVVLIALH